MDKKVLILGEFSRDEFVYGECKRLNPEAPTPVFVPEYEESNLGMAGNVYQNLAHLDINVFTIDECNGGNIVKTRFVDKTSNYILLRVDVGDDSIEPIEFRELNESYNLKDYDVIVVSDYNKGLMDKDTLSRLFLTAKSLGVTTFMDTKKVIGGWAEDCDYIKINEKESKNPEHYDLISSAIFENNMIVTLGNKGASYKGKIYETEDVPVRDVTGAGDTFISGLVYGYLKNNDIVEGIEIANKLASDVVGKRGVALPNKDLL